MDAPSGLMMECPNCGKTPHRVIRGRLSRGKEIVVEGVVRCMQCGYTRRETYREGRPLEVSIVISQGGRSERSVVELSPRELIRTGDKIDTADGRVEVTAIEVGGRRVGEATAGEVQVLWSKRVDKAHVKFSLNKGKKTMAFTLEVPPEEEFEVGSVVDLGRESGVVHRIKTKTGILREGSAKAEEIQRVYCRGIRHRRSGRDAEDKAP